MMTTDAHTELQRIADFDHPFRVGDDGSLSDAQGVYAPEVLHVEGARHPNDVEVLDSRWAAYSVGYTGQYSYNGGVMHASEYLGGRLADDMLADPGVYVVTTVEVLPTDEDPEPEPAGWTVLRLTESATQDAGLGVGHIWTAVQCPAYRTLNGADCTCGGAR